MQLSRKQVKEFQNKIFAWYAQYKRDLPWRELSVGISLQERAYCILVSEIMSQQTQILRVIPKYEAWLIEFPTIESLANATVSDVLRYWSGLGYNRRALNLKKTAEIIVQKYGGHFPQDKKTLQSLPGIGEYTARAILCFAFNQQVAVVDTNVRKVILTQFLKYRHSGEEQKRRLQNPDSGRASQLIMTDKQIQDIAQQLLPEGKAYEWNQALMDYAAAVLKKEKIPIPRQSKFIGSHRYYRGQVLKILLEKKKVAIKDLGGLIKKTYKDSEKQWLYALINELRDEGFIVVEQKYVLLSS